MLWVFQPTSAETFAKAQHTLADFRIPHHCRPELWCDEIALGQIAWVLLGVFLLHGTRLFHALGVVVVLAALLTLVQLGTQSNTLALLFPWRISAVLVPVATAVILGRLSLLAGRLLSCRAAAYGAGVVILLLAAGGAAILATRQAYQNNPEEEGLLAFVRKNRRPGDVYLLPIQVPDLKRSTRGSLSSDFKPVAEKQQDARLIPVDLQRFRLATGAAIYVDFKSIPYKDADVVAWRSRVTLTQHVQRRLRRNDDALADLLRFEGVTHVVVRAGDRVRAPGLAEVYRDSMYAVYRVIQAHPAEGANAPLVCSSVHETGTIRGHE